MQTYDSTTTVAKIVTDRPGRSRFFEGLGLDYCCGGNRPIGEACAEKGLDARSVLEALGAFEESSSVLSGEIDLKSLTTEELVAHIVERHHGYLRREFPRLAALSMKVLKAHGEREPRLGVIYGEVEALRRDLLAHLEREEREVFPLLGASAVGNERLAALIEELELEHDGTGDALRRMRELSDGYRPPSWACNTFRAFYDGLRELEVDVHEHVHEENNVLFPRFAAASR